MIGNIYKIECLSDPSIMYVGSTLQTIEDRWYEHQHQFKYWLEHPEGGLCSIGKQFNEKGIEDFHMVLIKQYNVVDRKHLTSYEQIWINKLHCVNIINPWAISKDNKFMQRVKRSIPEYKATRARCDKNYAENNKDKLVEYRKKYYEENKEAVSKQGKEYREKNKEKIAARGKVSRATDQAKATLAAYQLTDKYKETQIRSNKKQYAKPEALARRKANLLIKTQCGCGVEYITHTKYRHEKTEKHIYFITHGEPVKPYSERKKEFVDCTVCGEQYQIANKGRHYKTH